MRKTIIATVLAASFLGSTIGAYHHGCKWANMRSFEIGYSVGQSDIQTGNCYIRIEDKKGICVLQCEANLKSCDDRQMLFTVPKMSLEKRELPGWHDPNLTAKWDN